MKIIFLFLIFFFNYQYLSAVEFLGKFEQGSFILGKTKPNSKVKIDNKKIRVSKDGFFAFGLDRDRKNNVLIIIREDGKTKKIEKKNTAVTQHNFCSTWLKFSLARWRAGAVRL